MHDLDDDPRRHETWYAGPPPRRTPGPVVEAYADTETLEFDCTDGCGAPAGEFCKHPNGEQRKMPCLKRIETAAHAIRERGTATA
jgi:hypothetical protein